MTPRRLPIDLFADTRERRGIAIEFVSDDLFEARSLPSPSTKIFFFI